MVRFSLVTITCHLVTTPARPRPDGQLEDFGQSVDSDDRILMAPVLYVLCRGANCPAAVAHYGRSGRDASGSVRPGIQYPRPRQQDSPTGQARPGRGAGGQLKESNGDGDGIGGVGFCYWGVRLMP
jgi:hypothetical protein